MFTRCLSAAVLTVLLLAICVASNAATLNVPSGYSTIQTAINGAANGDTVVVAPGTYHERINFNGKAITVRSTAPTDPAVVASTTINGDGGGSVVNFSQGETTASVIAGFTITNGAATAATFYEGGGIYTSDTSPTITCNNVTGNTAQFGGGIWVHNGSPVITGNMINGNTASYDGGGLYSWYGSPIITNNIVSGNHATTYYGGGIDCTYGGGTIINNTISGNAAGGHWGGNLLLDYATVMVRNNIITFATDGGGVYITSSTAIDVRYCDVYGNTGGNYLSTPSQTGINGNVSVDPLFANVLSGDFHLKSIVGRWNGLTWVSDAVRSPCIDAGDPASPYANEPTPNGSRVNMGAFGNTQWASKTGSTPIVTYSISGQITDNAAHGLAGVQVAVGTYSATTDVDGNYTVTGCDAATYTVTPALPDYVFTPVNRSIKVGPNANGADFAADRRTYTVSGHIATTSHVAIPDVALTLGTDTTTTGPDGAFTFSGLLSGTYTLKATLAGYTFTPTKKSVLLDPASGDVTAADFLAVPPPSAPTVVAHTPEGTGASAEMPTISAVFSVSMIRNSAQAGFSISPTTPGGGPQGWPGTFSWVDNTMRFKLSTSLEPNTTYTVSIAPGVKSARGALLANEVNWTFTTGGVPAITAYGPTGTGVALDTTARSITLGFNQAMKKSSVADALWIYPASTPPGVNATRPPGVFSWNGNEVTYTFSNALAPLTTYCVKVGKTVRSAAGVSRIGAFVWSFTTGPVLRAPGRVTLAAVPTGVGAQLTVNLSDAADVTVRVRNLAGREVATLHPGQLPAGVTPLVWNGLSASGTRVPSGTYLLEVQAAGAGGASSMALGSVAL